MKALDFPSAFTYPFNRWQRLFYILWVLLPIFGWLALFGYQVRLVKSWNRGKFKELPKMEFVEDMKFGFWMFLKFIPLMGAFWLLSILLTVFVNGIGMLAMLLIGALILPMLIMNYFEKETVDSSFDLDAVKPVFNHFEDYLIAFLKTLALAAVWLILMLVLVGLPANAFTKNIFMADFYRRRVR